MQNEKLAAILLVIVIVGSISVFLTVTYGGDIFNNLFGEKKTMALGDCADVNFIGRFASNNTIFASSYNDTTNKTGGTSLKVFVSTNESEYSPTGYEDYTNLINDYYVKGFTEGLVGLKEGDTVTIGPIPPKDAYGVYPKVGDVITVSDPSSGRDIKIVIVNITENASMPADYVDSYGNGTTTLFVLRYEYYSLGEKMTVYPAWENATVVTKINDTKMWTYTTPPENKTENFTWIDYDPYSGYEILYADSSSSVTSINNTTIVITHNPQIGATVTYLDSYGTTIYFTVVNLTDEEINVSYVDESTGAISYDKFDRTVTIVRNESQNITETLTTPDMDYFLSVIIKSYVPNSTLSVNKLAGESLIFEVQIVKIYKTS